MDYEEDYCRGKIFMISRNPQSVLKNDLAMAIRNFDLKTFSIHAVD